MPTTTPSGEACETAPSALTPESDLGAGTGQVEGTSWARRADQQEQRIEPAPRPQVAAAHPEPVAGRAQRQRGADEGTVLDLDAPPAGFVDERNDRLEAQPGGGCQRLGVTGPPYVGRSTGAPPAVHWQ
jgi:hypothetical protein